MDNLVRETKKLIESIQNGLGFVERARTTEEAISVEVNLQGQLDKINGNCDRLDILVRKEPPNKREHAKLTVDQMKYDSRHLSQALQSLQRRREQRDKEERERDELMMTSFKPNSETSIMIDQALQHNTSVNSANRGVDDLIGTGQAVLDNLRGQRNTLKNAHKKVLDLMNTLGLTNTVMRLIERRTYQDKLLLYGGMIFTCIVMFLTVKYFLY